MIEIWPAIKYDVISELDINERNQCNNYFGEEIGYVIALLKLLSYKPNFDEKVRSLIIFTDVNDICEFYFLLSNEIY